MLKPAQLAALKAEILTDPRGLGLAGLFSQGAVSDIAGRLNGVWPAPRTWNPAAVAADYQVNEDAADTDAMVGAIHPADWATLSADQRDFFRLMTSCATLRVKAYHLAWVNANLPDATAPGQNSRKRVADILLRDGSRAEQLFGSGSTVTDADVVAARNLP